MKNPSALEEFDEKLASHLIDRDKLDAAGLDRAILARKASSEPLHRLLPMLGMVSDREMAKAIAAVAGLQLATEADYVVQPPLSKNVNATFLRSSLVIPIEDTEDALVIAAADPFNGFTVRALRVFLGKPIKVKVGVPTDIEQALERHYGQNENVDGLGHATTPSSDPDAIDDIQRLRDLASEAPVVRIVNRMITKAIEQHASDIHIEPFEHTSRIRYRMDGQLQRVEEVARHQHAALISRLKIMADLNIAERRLPQDGRIKLTARGREIDLRIATMPIMGGEAAVLRILDRGNVELDFDALGFGPANLKAYRQAISKPSGIVLVTGPTGSGKTTTLYTSLDEINSEKRKVLTVEDPIEFQLSGINQVQIKPKIGLTFAHVLRSMLRHDPDVIMVGEIRDLETAEVAIQAALTGHLVLSTLHTNSAASTLVRLKDMGVEGFLIASTLNAVVAQRLVRKLCLACREPTDPMPAILKELGLQPNMVKTFWKAKGCEVCHQTGYHGRVSINEVLLASDALRQAILETSDTSALHKVACNNGMKPMFLDGINKVLAGITTFDEVLRISHESV